jgi:AraC-like DNA-binding protein
MIRRTAPGVDRALATAQGVTRDGQPISYNRAPAADLAPWVARLYVSIVDAPADHQIACGVLLDTPLMHLQLRGDYTVVTADGPVSYGRAAMYFGPQSKRMPARGSGSFVSVGLAGRPGAPYAMGWGSLAPFVDRVTPAGRFGGYGEELLALLEPDAGPEDWLRRIEDYVRGHIDQRGRKLPDPITTRFELLAFADPTASIAEFARECGIDQRRLERIVRRDFGLTPKQVLRRARALDMASHLRGVADQDEAEDAMLRYYDESHLIREFTALFEMYPRQFIARPQPILTQGLESRQARRLELLKRLAPGALRPWEQPPLSRTAS